MDAMTRVDGLTCCWCGESVPTLFAKGMHEEFCSVHAEARRQSMIRWEVDSIVDSYSASGNL